MPARLRDLLTSAPGPFSGYQEVWDQTMCCICFVTFYHDELEPVTDEPGRFWDVCLGCAHREREHGATF